jgi:hypothetical protein
MYNLPEEEVVGPETLARLHQANLDFESWYKDWDTIFGEHTPASQGPGKTH